jgi:opacity protein-like surface antigen
MRRRLGIALVAAALVGTAAAAQAQSWNKPSERTKHWDLTLETRYQFEKDVDGEHGSKIGLDDDFAWGFAFGYNISERLLVGLDFGFNQIQYVATAVQAATLTPYDYSGIANADFAFVMAEYNILPKRLTPYVNGAAGWVTTSSNIVEDFPTGCYWDPWYGYVCNSYPPTYSSDGAGYRLGAGVRYDTGRSFILKLGYQTVWNDLDKVETIRFDQIRFDFGTNF